MAGVSEQATTMVVAESTVRVERTVNADDNQVHVDLAVTTAEPEPVSVRVVDQLPRVYAADSVEFANASAHTAGSTSPRQVAGEVPVPRHGKSVMRYIITVRAPIDGIGLTKVSSLIQPQIEGATPIDTPTIGDPSRLSNR